MRDGLRNPRPTDEPTIRYRMEVDAGELYRLMARLHEQMMRKLVEDQRRRPMR